jgi:two-component sensor histidine kinase
LFITGAGFYSIASAGYFITWFFPAHPTTGWLFNSHFLHLGLFGLYMLIVDFWQLPVYNPRLHQFGKVCIAVLITVSITGFCINYFTGNFNLSNNINLCTFVFPFSYATTVLYVCWHRLSRAQRYLYYGIVMFAAAALLVTLSSAIMHERSLLLAPWITNFTILAVFILFATGLKEELRQHEKDKFAALNSLNQFQKQQTIVLEAKVEERTKALQQSNELLATQKTLLAERNTRIETLINELSHRVKNNLQLLYSLISLQLPLVQDESSRNILRGNTARIKAMMLVNARLHHFEERSEINLHEFAAELTQHLQQVYDSKKRVQIEQQISEGILLQAKQTLSIGLILSELLTNSFKYAFNNNEAPAITIKATMAKPDTLVLTYADNGPGMKIDTTNTRNSMGLPLVRDLTRQLEGTININTENGLEYAFTFQLQDKQ